MKTGVTWTYLVSLVNNCKDPSLCEVEKKIDRDRIQ